MANIKSVRIKETKYGTYSLHYTNPDGCRRRLSVGKDYQHAQRLAVRFSDWLLEGKDPESEIKMNCQRETVRSVTIRNFYNTFMRRYGCLQSKNMLSSYHYCYKNICRCPKLADSILSTVTKDIMLDYMHLRMKQDGVGPATVNKEMNFVRSMLSRAIEWGILDQNPLRGFKKFREPEKRRVNITPQQVNNLLNLLPEPIENIVEFAVYSGFRKENILSLKIEQICFHDLTLTADVELIIKGGRQETFPLGHSAVEVLKRAIGKRKEGHVFINSQTGTRYVSIHKTFNRAVSKLGLTVNGTKLQFHDLRRIFCTWLLREGVSLDVIRELAGHLDRRTTDQYATIDRMEARKYLSLLPKINIPDTEYAEVI